MDAPDRSRDREVEQRNPAVWTRREVVAAMGAGVLAGTAPNVAAAMQQNLIVRFYGVMLARKGPTVGSGDKESSSVDLLMPYARSPMPPFHPDSTPAVPHFARLAYFTAHDTGSFIHPAMELDGTDFAITGNPSTKPADLSSLISLRNVLPATATRRPDTGAGKAHLTSRVRLVGGTITPLRAKHNMGKWRIGRTFNANAPRDLDPMIVGLEWDAGRPSAEVTGKTLGQIPATLTREEHPAPVIGHLSHDPSTWYSKVASKIDLKTADHDFKWLFALYVPRANFSDPDPWGAELGFDILLPAPRCYRAPDWSILEESTVGSSTCFGGEG